MDAYPPTGSTNDLALTAYLWHDLWPDKEKVLPKIAHKFQFTIINSAHDEWNPANPNPATYFVHGLHRMKNLPKKYQVSPSIQTPDQFPARTEVEMKTKCN